MSAPQIPPRKDRWSDAELARWAAEHPIGTPVRYWPLRGADDEYIDVLTRSNPWRLGHGHAVVMIIGVAGGVSLDHVVKIAGPLPPYDPTRPYLVNAHRHAQDAKRAIERARESLRSFFSWLLKSDGPPRPNEPLARVFEQRLARIELELDQLEQDWTEVTGETGSHRS